MWKLLNKHTSVSFNNNWDTFLLFTFSSARKCFLTSYTLQNNIVPSVENTFSPNCVTYCLKWLQVDTFCFGISIALRNLCTSQVTSILWVTSYKTKDSCVSIVGGTPEFQGVWRRCSLHWFLIYWDGHYGFTLRRLGVKKQHNINKKTLKWTFNRRR